MIMMPSLKRCRPLLFFMTQIGLFQLRFTSDFRGRVMVGGILAGR